MARTLGIAIFVTVLLGPGAVLGAPGHVELWEEFEVGLGFDDVIIGSVSSVVEDSHGNIYVADTAQEIVLKFSADGAFLRSMGSAGSGPGTFMPRFCIAMSEADEIYFAGLGGRVEVVDLEWTYKRSFKRHNPGSPARSIAVYPDGGFAIAAAGVATGTTVDVYGDEGAYLRSISTAFSFNKGYPSHIERPFVGSVLAVGPSGQTYVAQLCPYLVRKFDIAMALVDSTVEGGEEFVRAPSGPEISGDFISYRNNMWTDGIAAHEGGQVVVSAVQVKSVDEGESLICVYDSELRFVGSVYEPARRRVVGAGAGGRVYLVTVGETGKRVTRNIVVVSDP